MSNTVKGWLCAIAGMVTMGVSHLCYSIIIILMASMVAAVGCSAAEGALVFSITAIGSLVASLFIGSLLKVLKFALSGAAMTGTEIAVLVVGCVVAFAVSMGAIRFLMDYVKRHNFKFFGVYRIVLGLIVLAVAAITAIA